MIFGKSYREKELIEQARLRDLYGKRHREFALFPRRVESGEIIWLGWFWKEYYIVEKYGRYWEDKELGGWYLSEFGE